MVTLLGLYYLMFTPLLSNLPEALYARLDPAKGDQYSVVHDSFQPLDIRWELPGDTILRFYGVTLQGGDGQYTATVYTSFYPKNPLSQDWQDVSRLGFSYTLDGVETPLLQQRRRRRLYVLSPCCHRSAGGLFPDRPLRPVRYLLPDRDPPELGGSKPMKRRKKTSDRQGSHPPAGGGGPGDGSPGLPAGALHPLPLSGH